MRTLRNIAAFSLVSVSVSFASVASAQSDADRATARALAEEGTRALEAKDFTKAAELFGRAETVVRAPTLSLGFARAQVGLGRLVAAHETYKRIVREGVEPKAPKAYVAAFADAERELAELVPRLPGVTITVQGPAGARVTVDGVELSSAVLGVRRFVDPGEHVVVVRSEGYLTVEERFRVGEREQARVDAVLVRDPAFPPIQGDGAKRDPAVPRALPGARGAVESQANDDGAVFVGGIVIGSVGAASLVAAAVTGGLFLDRRSVVGERCSADATCQPDGLAAAEEASHLAVANTVTLVVGAAALGTGLIMAIVGAPRAEAPQATAFVTERGGGLLVGGRF